MVPESGPPADATRIVSLLEAVTVAELADLTEYEEILEDMRDECSKHGQVPTHWPVHLQLRTNKILRYLLNL